MALAAVEAVKAIGEGSRRSQTAWGEHSTAGTGCGPPPLSQGHHSPRTASGSPPRPVLFLTTPVHSLSPPQGVPGPALFHSLTEPRSPGSPVPKHILTYGDHWVLTGLANKFVLEGLWVAVDRGAEALGDWGLGRIERRL